MSTKTRCPTCREPTVHEFRPFCSRGCRNKDLINWADGNYRMPVSPEDEEAPEKRDYGLDRGD